MHPTRLRLAAATVSLGLVPALLSITGAVAGEANAAPAPYSAKITRTEHGIPHIVAKDFGSLGFGSGYAAAETSICTLADTVLTGRGQRSRYLGPNGKYDDQVSMTGTNLQVDTLATDLHDRQVVEKLLASKAGPGTQARDMVKGYAAGVNAWLRKIGGTSKIKDPNCRGAAYIQPNATANDIWYGVYLANLIASTGHFLPQITEAHPPSATDPGIPELPVNATFADAPKQLPEQAEADGCSRQGPQVAVRLQRDRHRRRRIHDRPRHGARQPALPVARALPVHPAAADDPGFLRRRGRQPGRLAGRQHRLEQERRLEPHGVHGLPVHAVRVPDARHPHVVPHHRGRQAARQARREGHGEERRRLALDGDEEPLPHRRRATCSTTPPR